MKRLLTFSIVGDFKDDTQVVGTTLDEPAQARYRSQVQSVSTGWVGERRQHLCFRNLRPVTRDLYVFVPDPVGR